LASALATAREAGNAADHRGHDRQRPLTSMAQQSRVNILNRRMDASVLLVKALGGGWRIDVLAQTQTAAGATAILDDHAK